MARAQCHSSLTDVGTARHVYAQSITRMLLNKTPVGTCQPAQTRLRKPGQIDQTRCALRLVGITPHVVPDRICVAGQTSGQQAQQRRLARTRLPHHRQYLTRVKGQN